jgi:hypothetical protein
MATIWQRHGDDLGSRFVARLLRQQFHEFGLDRAGERPQARIVPQLTHGTFLEIPLQRRCPAGSNEVDDVLRHDLRQLFDRRISRWGRWNHAESNKKCQTDKWSSTQPGHGNLPS